MSIGSMGFKVLNPHINSLCLNYTTLCLKVVIINLIDTRVYTWHSDIFFSTTILFFLAGLQINGLYIYMYVERAKVI